MSIYDGKIEPLPTPTKTLTEQWREGTLPEGCYYILDKNGHVKTERTCFYSHTDEQCFCFTVNRDIEEVLAPVPDYMDCKRLMNGSIELDKAKIKIYELVSKTEQLEKRLEVSEKEHYRTLEQLHIATGALREIKEHTKELSLPSYTGMLCNKALKEMEGVK